MLSQWFCTVLFAMLLAVSWWYFWKLLRDDCLKTVGCPESTVLSKSQKMQLGAMWQRQAVGSARAEAEAGAKAGAGAAAAAATAAAAAASALTRL